MKEDKLSILEELYEDSLQDKKILNDGLQKNLDRIDEINVFIDSIRKNEESEFKLFSPRSVEITNKEKIDDNENEIKKLELENEDYHQRLNKIEKQLDNIVYLIEENKSRDESMHLAIPYTGKRKNKNFKRAARFFAAEFNSFSAYAGTEFNVYRTGF